MINDQPETIQLYAGHKLFMSTMSTQGCTATTTKIMQIFSNYTLHVTALLISNAMPLHSQSQYHSIATLLSLLSLATRHAYLHALVPVSDITTLLVQTYNINERSLCDMLAFRRDLVWEFGQILIPNTNILCRGSKTCLCVTSA